MTDQELIKRLGGVKVIANFLGCKPNVVHNWVHRGIPSQVKVDHKEIFLVDNPKPIKQLDSA